MSSLPGVTCTTDKFFPAVINFQGCLYFIGGRKNEESDSVHKYSPDTNLWQQVAPLCVARHGVCAVAGGNSLYAIGGRSNNEVLDVVERFDLERNFWSRVASTVEKKVFSSGVFVKCFGKQGDTFCCSLQSYDVDNNEWKPCASIRGDVARELAWASLACLRIPKDIFRTLTVVL